MSTMENSGASDMKIVSRIFLTGWSIISVLLSLLGNTFVLVASKHGKAIKLDRVSIVLLENLAVADIGTALFAILPYLIWLFTSKHEGDHSSYVTTWTWISRILSVPSIVFMAAGMLLISLLNCCKLSSLLFPLRARTWRYRDGYKIVALVWIILTLTASGNWIISEHLEYCVQLAITTAGTSLLLLVVLASTLGLLIKVRKARGLRKKGVFSILLVSVVFFVGYTPLYISNLLDSIRGIGIGDMTLAGLITFNLYYINCFSNPLIYYFTLNSFKEYVQMIFQRCQNNLKCRTSVNSNDGEQRSRTSEGFHHRNELQP